MGCIVVDDGSTDGTWDYLSGLRDPRLRVYRQRPNQGEASARQFALKQSRGEFLCGVDADDWFYPDAIERMVEALQSDPEVFTVSLPLMVIGDDGRVLGVSGGADAQIYRVDELQAIRFPIPSSMVRTAEAQEISYDLRLVRGCDTDFQTRYLMGHCYRVLAEPGYAYYGESGLSTSSILKGLHFTRLAHWKWRQVFPVQVARLLAISFAKTIFYRLSRLLRGGDKLHVRFPKATVSQIDALRGLGRSYSTGNLTRNTCYPQDSSQRIGISV